MHDAGREDSVDGFGLATTGRSLPLALLSLRELLMERFRPLLAAHDVTEQQWRVLRVLNEAPDIDATELAAQASILAPSLSRILKALEARGFIEIGKDPDDRRRAIINLSRDGAAFIRAVAPQSAAIYAEITELIGTDRIDRFLDEVAAIQALLGRAR